VYKSSHLLTYLLAVFMMRGAHITWSHSNGKPSTRCVIDVTIIVDLDSAFRGACCNLVNEKYEGAESTFDQIAHDLLRH